jgi:hypothetical protein
MATTDIPSELIKEFQKWKTNRKINRAFVSKYFMCFSPTFPVKIDQEQLVVELEEEHEDIDDIEDLVAELPDSTPRFVVYT